LTGEARKSQRGWRSKSSLVTLVLMAATACGHAAVSGEQTRELSQKRYELGLDYFYKKMWEPALAEATRAVEIDPQNADARTLMGVLLMQKGVGQIEFIETDQCIRGQAATMFRREADTRFKEAEKQLTAALAARPGDPRALHNLALVAMHFNDYDAAIVHEQKALESPLFQDKHLAQGELGWAHYYKKDYVRALKELLEAVRLQPRYCVGHYRLAQVYHALAEKSARPDEEYANALSELEFVLSEKECRIQEAQYLRGLTLIKKRESAQADQPFGECVKLAPRSCLAVECQRYRRMVGTTTAAP
jgi:type IV pilus assembly protein PilF